MQEAAHIGCPKQCGFKSRGAALELGYCNVSKINRIKILLEKFRGFPAYRDKQRKLSQGLKPQAAGLCLAESSVLEQWQATAGMAAGRCCRK